MFFPARNGVDVFCLTFLSMVHTQKVSIYRHSMSLVIFTYLRHLAPRKGPVFGTKF